MYRCGLAVFVAPHKNWLIKPKNQDFETGSKDVKRTDIQMTYTQTLLWRTTISVFLMFAFVFPHTTSAWELSSILTVFTAKKTNKTKAYEAQKTQTIDEISLLSPAHNIDPNPSRGGGEITVTNDGALLANAGPSDSLPEQKTEFKRKDTDVYIVKEGDTLSGIAKMFDVSVNTIRWANDIGRKGTIRVGQKLTILPVTGVQYTVKRGGTLKDIVKNYANGKHFNEILEEASNYNDIDADEWLKKGTVVIIPDAEAQIKKSKNPWRTNRKYSRKLVRAKSAHGTHAPYYKGYYIRPVHGGVKTQGLHGYNAIDIGVPLNTPIYASASGKVIRAKNYGWNSGYGHYVMIEHPNGTKTLYAHANKVVVSLGQYVTQGQIIAYSGTTGHSTGPHLHFEIRGARNPF